MGGNSVFFYANFKAIFCLALVATLANFVLTQNLYTSILDDARDSLMSFSSGSVSPQPSYPMLLPPPRFNVSSPRYTSWVSSKFFHFKQQVVRFPSHSACSFISNNVRTYATIPRAANLIK